MTLEPTPTGYMLTVRHHNGYTSWRGTDRISLIQEALAELSE